MKHPYEDLPFLLVSGQARSGTTVLTRALATHPEVHSNGKESNFLRDVILALQPHLVPGRLSQLSVPADQLVLEFRRAWLRCLFPEESIRNPLPRAVSTFSSLRRECQPLLKTFFPHLMIVNIVRHGVEVVASRRVHASIGRHTFEEHCRAWAAASEMAIWGAEREDFFLVRHEWLRDPDRCQTAFSELFNRCGLSDSGMPAEWLKETRINTTRDEGETADTEQSLSGRRERWRNWSPSELEMFEQLCGPVMDYFGYSIPWRAA